MPVCSQSKTHCRKMISDSNIDKEINVKDIIYIMNMQKVYKIQIINPASVASFR